MFEQADLDFLLTEIPLAIDQTLEGTSTVTRIVRALNVFSHPGSDDFQAVDLNHELESTLTVSRNEWKYIAESGQSHLNPRHFSNGSFGINGS